MTRAALLDEDGNVLSLFVGELPQVLELDVPAAARAVVLAIDRRRYICPLAAGAPGSD